MITLKELPGSRIEVTMDNRTYQVDTLGQKDPYNYALNKALELTKKLGYDSTNIK